MSGMKKDEKTERERQPGKARNDVNDKTNVCKNLLKMDRKGLTQWIFDSKVSFSDTFNVIFRTSVILKR